jgi:hypothetical protein
MDPRIRIHTKMSWIRNTVQGFPPGRGDGAGAGRLSENGREERA